jgi:hypothetical protein
MPHTVALRLDDSAAARVARLWERLYVLGLDTTLVQPGSEPRIPLAVYPDDAPADAIGSAIDRLSACWHSIPVSITGITIIGSLSPVLSLAVAPTKALLALHEQLHKIMAEEPCDARWRPGFWTPAIGVSERAISVAQAVKCLLPVLVEPFVGALVGLDLVEQPSGSVIANSELSGG